MRWPVHVMVGFGAVLVACQQQGGAAMPGTSGGAGAASKSVATVKVTAAAPVVDETRVEAVGRMDGYINAEIRARVRGYLKQQHFHEGSVVDANALLFTLDPREFEAALGQARGGLLRAKSATARAESTLRRTRPLAAQQAASQQDLDNAEAAVLDARGQEESAQGVLDNALLNMAYTEVHSPIAGLVGISRVRVGNLVGQDGPTLLTTVSQIDPIRVNFSIAEADYLSSAEAMRLTRERRDLPWALQQLERLNATDDKAKPSARANAPAPPVPSAPSEGAGKSGEPKQAAQSGQPAQDSKEDAVGLDLVLADGQIYGKRGVLVTIDREVEATTGTIQLQALFPNPDNVLRPGAFGRIQIPRQQNGKKVLAVPAEAIKESQGRASVNVVQADGTVATRQLQLGGVQGSRRLVLGGLQPGECVVVEGGQKVHAGDKVNAERWQEPAAAAAPRDDK